MEQVFENALQVKPVSERPAIEFRNNQPTLCQLVDQNLIAHPSLTELIGIGAVGIMKKNHQYHARFMSNVFQTNNFPLLARIAVWAYRSYKSHGFSYDYFPVELRAWQEAVSKLLPASEALEIIEVYEWMLTHHNAFIQVAESSDYRLFPLESEFDHLNNN